MNNERNYAYTMATMRGHIAGLVDTHTLYRDTFVERVHAAIEFYWAVKDFDTEEACRHAIQILDLRVEADKAGHRVKVRVQNYPDGEIFIYAETPTEQTFIGPYRDPLLAQTVSWFLAMESVRAFSQLIFDNFLKRIDAQQACFV